jgi:hypothetical protein
MLEVTNCVCLSDKDLTKKRKCKNNKQTLNNALNLFNRSDQNRKKWYCLLLCMSRRKKASVSFLCLTYFVLSDEEK